MKHWHVDTTVQGPYLTAIVQCMRNDQCERYETFLSNLGCAPRDICYLDLEIARQGKRTINRQYIRVPRD